MPSPKRKPMTQIEELRSIGLTDEQIRAIILKGGEPLAQPGGFSAPPVVTVDKRQDQNLGPDPELVARLEAHRATYKPPVLEVTYDGVTLKSRYAAYVEQYAMMINARRPNSEPIGPEKAIELIVMAYRIVDPDRALIEGARGRTAPKALPPADWAQKTA